MTRKNEKKKKLGNRLTFSQLACNRIEAEILFIFALAAGSLLINLLCENLQKSTDLVTLFFGSHLRCNVDQRRGV